LPARALQPLIAALVALGIPAAAVAAWHHLLSQHPVGALLLAIGWLVICGTAFLARQAFAAPAQRRLEQAGSAADRAAGWWLSRYGRRYRRWVLDARRYIDVKDLATGGDHTPELDDIYVDVALVRRAPHQISGNPLSGVREDVTGRHSVSEFLSHREPVVLAIIGPPGCGKSTLLAYVARQTAKSGHRIPILLTLREHAAAIAASPQQTLPDSIRAAVRSMPGQEPDGWWDRQLQRHRCVVLLDGLDEVAREEDRRAVATWVERQVTNYSGNVFLITSRPHGFPGPIIAQANVLSVQPFTAEQVTLFLNRWYLATEKHATGATTEAQLRSVRILAAQSADRLGALLRANPALHDLTVNPLLLTMIALVHRYRGALPGSRADLYGEICQVMVTRRNQAKDLPEVLPGPAKHKLLTALAYQMMIDRYSELPTSKALKVLDPLMRRLPRQVTAQQFLDDVSRNGLLAEPGPGKYAFAHLTFQEYLAARHISDNPGLAGVFSEAVDEPWWRETMLLYSAITNADQIVRACLDKGTIPALALAFDCTDASAELAPDLRQRLDEARDKAFADDCPRHYRRTIAAVLATRLSRQTISSPAGTRICARPVPADLYRLFLTDTEAPEPDSPCDPDQDRPATGIWGSEAVAFVRWLNEVVEDSQLAFRLPKADDLESKSVTDQLAEMLAEPVTGIWMLPEKRSSRTELWAPNGQPHPHHVRYNSLRWAVQEDASNFAIFMLSIYLSALDMGWQVMNNLLLCLYSLSEGKNWVLSDQITTEMLSRTSAIAIGLVNDLDRPRADYGGNYHDLPRAVGNAARQIFDLDLIGALDQILLTARSRDKYRQTETRVEDLGHYLMELRTVDASASWRDAASYARAASLALERSDDLAKVLATDGDRAREFARHPYEGFSVIMLGIPGVPLSWINRGPLGRAAREAIISSPPPSFLGEGVLAGELCRIFAMKLLFWANIPPGSSIAARLDGSLESLRRVKPRAPKHDDGVEWYLAYLVDVVAPIYARRREPAGAPAAGLRAISLALAADCDLSDDTFRELAATITLLQEREQGKAPIGEAILLALA
jgi:energy-coupling factor transporter ATP-binding protein EcfA2